MRPLGFVGPTFPPEVNERLQYEVLLPFMLHIIYDAFGRLCRLHDYVDYRRAIFQMPCLAWFCSD